EAGDPAASAVDSEAGGSAPSSAAPENGDGADTRNGLPAAADGAADADGQASDPFAPGRSTRLGEGLADPTADRAGVDAASAGVPGAATAKGGLDAHTLRHGAGH